MRIKLLAISVCLALALAPAFSQGRISKTEVRALLKDFAEGGEHTPNQALPAIPAITALGNSAISVLKEIAEDPKVPLSERALAAYAFGEVGTPESVAALKGLMVADKYYIGEKGSEARDLTEDGVQIVNGAFKALAQTVKTNKPGKKHALDLLASYLKDPDHEFSAAVVLGETDDRGAIPPLRSYLEQKRKSGSPEDIRNAGQAAVALAQLGDIDVRKYLVDGIIDPGWRKSADQRKDGMLVYGYTGLVKLASKSPAVRERLKQELSVHGPQFAKSLDDWWAVRAALLGLSAANALDEPMLVRIINYDNVGIPEVLNVVDTLLEAGNNSAKDILEKIRNPASDSHRALLNKFGKEAVKDLDTVISMRIKQPPVPWVN